MVQRERNKREDGGSEGVVQGEGRRKNNSNKDTTPAS